MEQMRTFYIRGSIPKDHPFPIVSWAIRFFTWSKISHTFSCFPLMKKIFHAHFNNVEYKGPEYLNQVITRENYQLDVPAINYSLYVKILDSFEGKKRGYFLQLFGVLIALFVRLFGMHIRNPFRKLYSSVTCTELIITGLVTSGIFPTPEGYPYFENWTEKDLFRFLDERMKDKNSDVRIKKLS